MCLILSKTFLGKQNLKSEHASCRSCVVGDRVVTVITVHGFPS